MIAAVAAAPASAATKPVTIQDFAFSPSSLSVSKGTKVVWRFRRHRAQRDRPVGPEEVPLQGQASGTFKKKLKLAGTYRIYCSIHPDMKQTITVR